MRCCTNLRPLPCVSLMVLAFLIRRSLRVQYCLYQEGEGESGRHGLGLQQQTNKHHVVCVLPVAHVVMVAQSILLLCRLDGFHN